MNVKMRIALGTVAVLAVAVPAAPASAKSYKLNFTSKLVLDAKAKKVTGTFAGTPFGKGTAKGTANLPVFVITFKGKGGSVTMRFKGAPVNDKIKGKFTFTKGTGKYKGIKGSGTGTASVKASGANNVAANFKYKGTAKY